MLDEVRILPNDPFKGKYDFKSVKPFKEDDTLRVYHAFNSYEDAYVTALFGLSGQERAKRIYSYESGNNPKGLFITLDFKKAKEFVAYHPRIIMEFQCKYADLEAPVWVGGRSYFVQGEYTKSFKDENEREAQRLENRKKYSNPSEAYDDPVVYNSDRPELAFTLRYVEASALFVGNLNPNMIRAFWVAETHERNAPDTFIRYDRKAFIEKFAKPYQDKVNNFKPKAGERNYNQYEKYHEKDNKLFKPNDDFNLLKLKEIINKSGWSGSEDYFIELMSDYIKTGNNNWELNNYFYPKQLNQIKNMSIEQLGTINPTNKDNMNLKEEVHRLKSLMEINNNKHNFMLNPEVRAFVDKVKRENPDKANVMISIIRNKGLDVAKEKYQEFDPEHLKNVLKQKKRSDDSLIRKLNKIETQQNLESKYETIIKTIQYLIKNHSISSLVEPFFKENKHLSRFLIGKKYVNKFTKLLKNMVLFDKYVKDKYLIPVESLTFSDVPPKVTNVDDYMYDDEGKISIHSFIDLRDARNPIKINVRFELDDIYSSTYRNNINRWINSKLTKSNINPQELYNTLTQAKNMLTAAFEASVKEKTLATYRINEISRLPKLFELNDVEQKVNLKQGVNYRDITTMPENDQYEAFTGDETGKVIQDDQVDGNEIRVQLDNGKIVLTTKDAIDGINNNLTINSREEFVNNDGGGSGTALFEVIDSLAKN